MSVEFVNVILNLVNAAASILGISGVSSSLRRCFNKKETTKQPQPDDVAAKEAVRAAVMCFQCQIKWIDDWVIDFTARLKTGDLSQQEEAIYRGLIDKLRTQKRTLKRALDHLL
jgi:hypothetical protein